MVVILDEKALPQAAPSGSAAASGESSPPPYAPSRPQQPITVNMQSADERDLPRILAQSMSRASTSSSSRSSTPASPPLDVQPCNFLHIDRHHSSIKGQFILDPSLPIPANVLPPLRKKKHIRKNLNLEGDHGAIDAEVWVIDSAARNRITTPGEKARRTPATIRVKNNHGSVRIKTHSYENVPVQIWLRKEHGNAELYLPREFSGPLTFKTNHSSVILSPALQARTMTFSDSKGVHQGFLGDLASSGWEGHPDPHPKSRDIKDGNYNAEQGARSWKGDALVLSSNHAKIRMFYEDEVPEPNVQPQQGAGVFIKKLFSGYQASPYTTGQPESGPSRRTASPVRVNSFGLEGKQSLNA